MGIVAFYVSAHQDDWQLFRGDQAWIDVASGAQIVFVYMTAGDAGGGPVPGWWQAREQGALASCRLLTGPNPLLWGVKWFNNHPITMCLCGNTTSYFLRLPDGSLDGVRASNAPINAIDGSTLYSGWDDICSTLKVIFDEHRNEAGQDHPWINSHDYNIVLNPEDNPDHISTGHAVNKASRDIYKRAWWVGYNVATRSINLDDVATERKRRLQLAYTNRILLVTSEAGTPYDDWSEAGAIYESWLNKSYARGDSGEG